MSAKMFEVNPAHVDVSFDRKLPDLMRVLPVVEIGQMTPVDVNGKVMVVVLDFQMEVMSTVEDIVVPLFTSPVTMAQGVQNNGVLSILSYSNIHVKSDSFR